MNFVDNQHAWWLTVWYVMVWYTSDRVYFCRTPTWNKDLQEKVGENLDVNFVMKQFPAWEQFTIWWINSEQLGSQLARNKNIGAKCLLRTTSMAQEPDMNIRLANHWIVYLKETGVSKSSARRTTQLLELRPHKTTVIHAHLAAARSS
jgi:hypothetical protein